MARFDDLREARAAIQAVEHAGVDAGGIELLGRGADAARHPARPGPADRQLVGYLLPRLARGFLLGLGGGLVAGAALGAIVATASGWNVSAAALATGMVGGGLLGATLGVFLAFERGVGLSEEWTVTFEDASSGPVWVAVHTQSSRDRALARAALARMGPLELRGADASTDRRSRDRGKRRRSDDD